MNSIIIFGREIPLYGIFFYLGIAAAALAGLLICKRKGLPKIELVYSGVYVFVGALLGAKLLFLAVSLKQIIEYHIPIIYLIKGGFVFYGGFIGGALGLFIYTKQFKESFIRYADIYAAVVPFGHAFGRVGCFFAGCCYGIPVKWGHVYTTSHGSTPLGVPLLPIQLIESACLLLIFGVMMLFVFRWPKKTGFLTSLYLILYPVTRFVLEFFRGDAERGVLLLSTSQWVSLLIIAATVGVNLLVVRRRKEAQNKI